MWKQPHFSYSTDENAKKDTSVYKTASNYAVLYEMVIQLDACFSYPHLILNIIAFECILI